MTGLTSYCALTVTVAWYKWRILTKKHVHNKSIAVLKNTGQNERYVSAIQSLIEKIINSYDFSSRIGNNKCKRKRGHGESSVGKVADLIHVEHKHASIMAEIYLGTPAAFHGCHAEP